MLKKNFHTHTYLCKHASGTVDDYCRAAISSGLSVLGFSDHCPHPDDRWSSVRMSMDELPGYLSDIEQASIDYPELKVLKSLECEYVPEFIDFQREFFLGELALDYLIGAAHWYFVDGEAQPIYGAELSAKDLMFYAEYIAEMMHSGLYAAIAHPDLFGVAIWDWNDGAEECSRLILKEAAKTKIPLEFNAYGLRKKKKEYADGTKHMYPIENFWKLASEYDIKVLISSDAHRPEDVWGNNDDCYKMVESLGLTIVNEVFAASPNSEC